MLNIGMRACQSVLVALSPASVITDSVVTLSCCSQAASQLSRVSLLV